MSFSVGAGGVTLASSSCKRASSAALSASACLARLVSSEKRF